MTDLPGEFGFEADVRFAGEKDCSVSVSLYDSEGNEITDDEKKCSCGKPGVTCVMGSGFHQWLCADCMGYGDKLREDAPFGYCMKHGYIVKPNECCPFCKVGAPAPESEIINPDWVVNLRSTEDDS